MKAFKYILFLLLIAFIGTATYIAVQPNFFEVSRTRTIKAPKAVVHNNVIDFKNWRSWSSWVEENPNMKIILSEQTIGIGGSYSWEDKDGMGKMKTIDAVPNTSIKQEMQFADFPSSTILWEFKSNNGATDVTWSISGNNLPFSFKIFAAFTGGMEKQIAPHYERSLEKLDSVIQASMKVYSIEVNGISQHSGGYYLYNTTACKTEELSAKRSKMMLKVIAFTTNKKITTAGNPFINYHKWDLDNNTVMFSCCIPTTEKITTTDSDILTGQLQPFKALKTTLKGNYKNLEEAWEITRNHISKNNLEEIDAGVEIESYNTDPTTTPNPADWVTEIYIEVK